MEMGCNQDSDYYGVRLGQMKSQGDIRWAGGSGVRQRWWRQRLTLKIGTLHILVLSEKIAVLQMTRI